HARSVLGLAPAVVQPAGDDRSWSPPLRAEALHSLRPRTDGAIAVADPRGKFRRLRSEAREENRRHCLGKVVNARVLYAVVNAAMALHAALPQAADDVHGLL